MKNLVLIIALFLLSGCATMLLSKALAKDQMLSVEQIEAYRKVGQKVYGCLQIGGPPPAGNMIWLIMPSDSKVTPNFGDNCHLLSR